MVNLKKQVVLESKEITVGTRELLDVLQIIHVMKKVNSENPDEVLLLDDMVYKMMDGMKNDKGSCSITMNNKDLFSVWLCIDSYKTFCDGRLEYSTEDDDYEERDYSKRLLKMFSWPK